MGFMDGLLRALDDTAYSKTGRRSQQEESAQKERDWQRQATDFSVEAQVADTLTNLTCWGASITVSGETDRARRIAQASRDFMQGTLEKAMSLAFVTGDCLVVPTWNGRGFSHSVVPRHSFRILTSAAGEPMAVAYLVDERTESRTRWQLVQVMALEDYDTGEGAARGCRYYTRLLKNGSISNESWKRFPEWEQYQREWTVPNVSRLLLGRYKCFQMDKLHPNAVYGVPLCYGASKPIREIHYLMDQLHNEFELSEKAVFASKAMFAKDSHGNLIIPKGQDRLFMALRGGGVDDNSLKEWAPSIQAQPYMDALDLAKKELEKAIGVDSGIISTPPDTNYQNVDSVRKSMRNTQAFIERARDEADRLIDQMVYAWDMLLNFYGHPTGSFAHSHDWSDDYIESLNDKREAIIAGYSIGATDAYDYRLQVLGESPEIAAERVQQIRDGRQVTILAEE